MLARHKSWGHHDSRARGHPPRSGACRIVESPPLPNALKPWERVAAHVTHYGLYILLFAMLLTGWAMSSARKYPVSWFNLVQLPDFVAPNRPLYDTLHTVHMYLSWALIAIAVLHIGAALKHHFVLKDDVLQTDAAFHQNLTTTAIRRGLSMIGPTMGFKSTAFRAGAVLVATMLLAALAVAAGAPVKYTLDAPSSLLRFNFEQAGANNTGRFGKYTADVTFSAENLAASKIDVSIDVASLDTGDQERDDTPQGRGSVRRREVSEGALRLLEGPRCWVRAATKLTGKLTIRNVTKEVKLPHHLPDQGREGQAGGVSRRPRHDQAAREYGVGQGEWKSTEWVKDDVLVTFSLKLNPAT